MKHLKSYFIITFFLFFLLYTQAFATFSICAVDTVTKEVGSAGASCIGAPQIPQGCLILSDVHPGVGVVHTQASYLEGNQNLAKGYMNQGDSPQEIVDKVVANDVQSNSGPRQYGVVDLVNNGRSAAYSGSGCQNYKGHLLGTNYAIQGNILLGKEIIDSMEARFLETEGPLADKLMAALQGAKVRGADTRCHNLNKSTISSFLRVAKPNDPNNDLYCDLNVPTSSGSTDPIDVLQDKYDDWLATSSKQSFTIHHKGFKLFQNNPNPFIHSTHISFLLPENGRVMLKIYTPSGKEIKTLVNRRQPSGQHVVSWNGTDNKGHAVIGGIYLAVLHVNDAKLTCKMLLIR